MERIAGQLWRLRRAPFFEAAIFDARWSSGGGESRARRLMEADTDEQSEMSDAEWRLHVGDALVWDALGNTLGNLGRHETTADEQPREDAGDAV